MGRESCRATLRKYIHAGPDVAQTVKHGAFFRREDFEELCCTKYIMLVSDLKTKVRPWGIKKNFVSLLFGSL